MSALVAASALGALATALASLLLFASRRLTVEEDPRFAAVEAALPGVNCGACGQPSCRAFAEALIAGTAVPAGCSVSTPDARARIAGLLGVAVGTAARRVARLACAGGRNRAPFRAYYRGERTCAAASQVAGGGKACSWGCLNFGDCVRACHFDAMRLDEHGLPLVDETRCTACGDCVSACPRDLFRLEPVSRALWVDCSNPESGDALLAVCSVACTACGRCAHDAPGAIRMTDNLPVVEPGTTNPPRAAIERCPTGAIVWIENGRRQTGAAARHPARETDLPLAPQ